MPHICWRVQCFSISSCEEEQLLFLESTPQISKRIQSIILILPRTDFICLLKSVEIFYHKQKFILSIIRHWLKTVCNSYNKTWSFVNTFIKHFFGFTLIRKNIFLEEISREILSKKNNRKPLKFHFIATFNNKYRKTYDRPWEVHLCR